jgi:hypothetical protein
VFFSIRAAVTKVIEKAECFRLKIMRLTIYIPPYLIAFKTRLPLWSYIYKTYLLKLPLSPFLHKAAPDRRLTFKLNILKIFNKFITPFFVYIYILLISFILNFVSPSTWTDFFLIFVKSPLNRWS